MCCLPYQKVQFRYTYVQTHTQNLMLNTFIYRQPYIVCGTLSFHPALIFSITVMKLPIEGKYVGTNKGLQYCPCFSFHCHTEWVMVGLTHWGRVTHICVGKLSIIGSDNGLSPGRRQAIIWTNAGILFIGPLGTNFSENWIGIETFSIKEMHLKMSSAKWHLFGLGLDVLKDGLPFVFRTLARSMISSSIAYHIHRAYSPSNGCPPYQFNQKLYIKYLTIFKKTETRSGNGSSNFTHICRLLILLLASACTIPILVHKTFLGASVYIITDDYRNFV